MGWNMFSNGRETVVGTSSSKVFDDYTDDRIAAINAALRFKLPVLDVLNDLAQGSMVTRASKFFSYGFTKSNFAMPISTFGEYDIPTAAMEYMQGFNAGKSPFSVEVRNDSFTTQIMNYLVSARGMDLRTGELSNPLPSLPKANLFQDAYFNATTGEVIFSYANLGFLGTETVSIAGLEDASVVFIHKHLLTTNEHTYVYGSGQPAMDQMCTQIRVNTSNKNFNSYYPIVPFYIDDARIGDPSKINTPNYMHAKAMVKRLGMSYADVSDSLHDGVVEQTGDHKGLYAYMMFGVDPVVGLQTDSAKYQGTLQYLYAYFKYIRWGKDKSNKFSLQVKSDSYVSTLRCDKFDSRYSSQSLYAVGTVVSTFNSATKRLTFAKQLNADTCHVLSIYNLKQEFEIYDGKSATVTVEMAFKDIDTDVVSTTPSTNGVRMRIPMRMDLLNATDVTKRNEVLHNGLVFIFNSYQRVKVKWYQSPGWGAVIQIIAIVFALPSGGQSLTWSQALIAALSYAVNIAISKAIIKFAVKQWGIEVAILLFIASAAYSGYKGIASLTDTIKMAVKNIWSAFDIELKNKMAELQKNADRAHDLMQELEEELRVAKDLLGKGHEDSLNPWLFVNPLPELNFSEDVSRHVDNKLSVVNSVDIATNMATNYPDLMVTLPTFDETIRMNTRGKQHVWS